MNLSKLFIASLATVTAVATVPAAIQAESPFSDLTDKHPFYTSIMELANRDVLSGYTNGTIGANRSVTRAEAAVILAKALKLDTKNVKNPNFKDVKTDAWYYGPIAALAEKNILNGYNGEFNPNDKLTRGQMAVVLTSAFNLEKANTLSHPFTDVAVKDYYSYHVQTLFNNSITGGVSATKFGAKDDVTRGMLAEFVIRSEKAVKGKPTPNPVDPKPTQPVDPTPTNPIEPTPDPTTPVDPAPTNPQVGESVATILAKYEGQISSLESSATSQANALVAQALAEYESGGIGFSQLLDKYAPKAANLEASVDAQFANIYSAVVAELQKNGHSASAAQSLQERYQATKEALKSTLLSM